MFDSKKEKLFEVKTATSVDKSKKNAFLGFGLKKSAETVSGNYAKKYDSTGNPFVDQFGSLSMYKVPRKYSEIEKDMSTLWAINKQMAVSFILFIRMITRVVSLFNGTKTTSVQRGAGLKHEGIMRMIWLYEKDQNVFWKNLPLFVSIGSWKDIFQMLSYDLQYHGWENRILNWDLMFTLISAGLENPNTNNLVKKYLPQIKSNNKCKTVESQADNIIAKWIASKLFDGKMNSSYKKYRELKTSGTAHTWQQLISKGRFLDIDFDSVHGKALLLMVSGKFIENQGLVDKYGEWIESKPIAKFTGFVHELFQKYIEPSGWTGSKLKMKSYQINTLQKQFDGLVETAKKNAKTDTSMIVVRDTSGSMGSQGDGTNMSCGDLAKSLALFFSKMLPNGYFSNSWIEFSNTAKMHTWKGETVYEMWNNDNSSYVGGTNFQSVIDLFVKIKKSGVSEEEFPTGIICISDGEFNPSGDLSKTNVATAFRKLSDAGFTKSYIDNFKVVLWDLRNNYYGYETNKSKFETHGDVKNVYYFSGYEASIIAFLTGVDHQEKEPQTAEELFEAAMNQEILNMVEL